MKNTDFSLAPLETAPAPGASAGTAAEVRTCPRCSYTRKPTDTAPAWQCPRCEVAYNKVQPAAPAATPAAAARARPAAHMDDDDEDDDFAPARRRQAAPGRDLPWTLIGLGAGAALLAGLMVWKAGNDRDKAAERALRAASDARAAQVQEQRASQRDDSQLTALENRWHFGEGAAVLPTVRSLAEGGDTRAMVLLFNMLHGSWNGYNKDIPKNHAEAMQWLQKAASQGDPVAAVRLGGIYERGEDEPRQPALAENWYLRAARQGHAPGLYSLGDLYARGVEPVGQRPVAAYMLLELATRASREQPTRDQLLPEQHSASSAQGQRDRLARNMTPDDIAEGKRRAEAWKPGQPLGI